MATGAPPPSPRTDLHKEPIGNMVCQLAGRKRWLLVAPEESSHLMPRLSVDGCASARVYGYHERPLSPFAPHARSDVRAYTALSYSVGSNLCTSSRPSAAGAFVFVPFLRPRKCRRAYFQSAHPPESVGERIAHVRQRWTVDTGPGDVLWVPTWTWHRVDYLPGETALSASIFHFRPEQFLWSDPMSSLLILPNILKELIGWKTQ